MGEKFEQNNTGGQFNKTYEFVKVIEKDSKGRTFEDIVNELEKNGAEVRGNKKFLDSIVFKNGEFYIYGTLADVYIVYNKRVFGSKKETKKEESIPCGVIENNKKTENLYKGN